MNTPYISVIIPLYDKEAIVERSVQSVLNQSYTDFELIIVDDGSTDNSAEIVRGINDDRIVFIQQENGGPSKARNTGVQNANGEWVLFLDADDELLPNALEHFKSLIDKHDGIEMFCCEYFVADGIRKLKPYTYCDKVVEDNFREWVLGRMCPRTGATIYTKRLVMSCPFDSRIRRFEDLESLFRMYKQALIYTSSTPVLKLNMQFAAASRGRKDISEDFLGYIDVSGKGFWETLAHYKVFHEGHILYEEQCRKLYPHLYKRFDLKAILMVLSWIARKRYGNNR